MVSLPLFYGSLLRSDPRNVVRLAGDFLVIAAGLGRRVRSAAPAMRGQAA